MAHLRLWRLRGEVMSESDGTYDANYIRSLEPVIEISLGADTKVICDTCLQTVTVFARIVGKSTAGQYSHKICYSCLENTLAKLHTTVTESIEKLQGLLQLAC